MVEHIVLYRDSKRASPYVESVKFCLDEVGASYTVCDDIDLSNKPAWFKQINPREEVPALTYGRTNTLPNQLSEDCTKLYESLVLLDFVAETFPGAKLLPSKPEERARVRLFANAAVTRFGTRLFTEYIRYGKNEEGVLSALEELQAMLPEKTCYAAGDNFTIADAALAPALWRFEIALKHEVGRFAAGEGRRILNIYEGQRFAKIRTYFRTVKENKHFKAAISSEEDVVTYYRGVYPKI